jgi:transglutaminase-like putative cysteine protease
MRFALAHKASTYLMIACAYGAMAGGGGMPPLVALGGLIGLLGSWWWEPPLVRLERWAPWWTGASVLALAYAVVTAVATGDYLGVGGQFLLWLLVAKAYNRRAARDWLQLYLLSFLMLVAGSVLNADLTYGLCFLGFVVATTWALTMFHLRREMEDNFLVKHASADRASEPVEVRRILDSRRIVDRRFFLGTGLLSLAVFVGAAIAFLALPRVGVGFFFKSRGGLTLAGFADGVKLGGHGVLKNDATVVMRVEVPASIGGRGAPEIHWRGVAFDRYSAGQWARSGRAPATRSTTTTLDGGLERRVLLGDRPMMSPAAVDALAGRAIRQEVWLEPLDSDVLFGASTPRLLAYPSTLRPRKPRLELNDEVRLERSGTLHYTVWSTQTTATAAELRAARGPLPAGYQVYLQLPDEITPRTRALAAKITAGLTNDYDRAQAIVTWLDDNLSYTLELVEPVGEPVDFFLFERKQGHCEYFGSAFAVLARSVGIPTRSVNGFLGGEWNEYEGYVQVRAGDAHSWDEVYFPGVGWITFDPTPSGQSELGRGGDGITARLGRFMDTLRFQWTKWVLEYDLAQQLSLFRSIGSTLKGAASSARDALVALKRAARNNWPLGVALGAAVALVVLWRRRHAGPLLTIAGGRRRPRPPLAALYDQATRLLAKSGVPREPALTPRELATRLTAAGHPAEGPLAELTELYYGATWGGRSDPADLRRAEALLGELRGALAPRRGTPSA